MSRSSDGIFYLRIEDGTSGLLLAEVKLDADAMADFMSTRTTKLCETEYYHNPSVGKKLETQTVQITVENSDLASLEVDKIFLLAEEENEGWAADRETFNHYRYDHKNQTYKVILRRYV